MCANQNVTYENLENININMPQILNNFHINNFDNLINYKIKIINNIYNQIRNNDRNLFSNIEDFMSTLINENNHNLIQIINNSNNIQNPLSLYIVLVLLFLEYMDKKLIEVSLINFENFKSDVEYFISIINRPNTGLTNNMNLFLYPSTIERTFSEGRYHFYIPQSNNINNNTNNNTNDDFLFAINNNNLKIRFNCNSNEIATIDINNQQEGWWKVTNIEHFNEIRLLMVVNEELNYIGKAIPFRIGDFQYLLFKFPKYNKDK
ncbi:MAG: hypothetical protein ACTSRZ_08310 [Promethearchaeota archaeon]